MLAYIFWHRPFRAVDRSTYERDLRLFHQALGAACPPGWLESWSFRVRGLPWIGRGALAYEDWYLVEDFGALGPLNEQAVAGPCRELHDRVARAAESGAGGLYRLHSGQPTVGEARFAIWLAKPRATQYAAFYQLLAPLVEQAGGSLWRRQLVLSPAPEFCMLATKPVTMPGVLESRVCERTLIVA